MTTWRGMFLDMRAAYGKQKIKFHRPNHYNSGLTLEKGADSALEISGQWNLMFCLP